MLTAITLVLGMSTFGNSAAQQVAVAAGADSAPDEQDHPRWNPSILSIGAKNLVPNGSFECGPAGWSSIGKPTAWGGDLSSLYGTVVSDAAFHGSRSLRIDLGTGKTPVTYFDGWPSAKVVQTSPLATHIGWMRVEKGVAYTLSAWMKADRPDVPAKLVFRFGTDPLHWAWPSSKEKSVTVGKEWARYSLAVRAEEPDLYVSVGPDMTATPDEETVVWIDAVQVERGGDPSDFEPREEVEVGFETGRFGNVFSNGDQPAVTVYAANEGKEAIPVTATAQLEDYFGNLLPPSNVEFVVPAKRSTCTLLPLRTAGRGHYRARLTGIVGGFPHEETLVLAVIDPFDGRDGVFGINHAPTTGELSRLLRNAGIAWARDTAFDWNQLEPSKGRLSFEKTDEQIGREAAQGFRSLAILPVFPSTEWNSTAPTDVKGPGWIRLTYAPNDPSLLYTFVSRAVATYKGRVSHYEFINEPVWIPSPGANLSSAAGYGVADYLELLKRAYPAMKAADPDCTVLGGLSIQAEMPLGDTFIEQGGLQYCDVYNLHPYPTPNGAPERFIADMERILRAMDTYGGRKPIWATETAYFAQDDLPWTPWVAPAGNNGAVNLTTDERRAADFSVRLALILLSHGVEKIFYHQGIEGEVNNGSWALDNPLLGPLATPKKFYVALAALAKALGAAPSYGAPFAKPEHVGERSTDEVYGYAFNRAEGGSVLAVWTSQEPATGWALRRPSDTVAYNVVGNPVKTSPVPVTGSPMYFLSDSLGASDLAAACTLVPTEAH